jgi:hypothetical protein
MSAEMILPNLQDRKKLGSAITYYRRYTTVFTWITRRYRWEYKASAPVK